MTPAEAAYVGAFLDAEGNLQRNANTRHCMIKVVNGNIEIISALLRAVGTGRVVYAGHSRLGKMPLWVWCVHRLADLNVLLPQLAPYSMKAQEALAVNVDAWADRQTRLATCRKGHPRLEKRTYLRKNGGGACRDCAAKLARERRRAAKEK